MFVGIEEECSRRLDLRTAASGAGAKREASAPSNRQSVASDGGKFKTSKIGISKTLRGVRAGDARLETLAKILAKDANISQNQASRTVRVVYKCVTDASTRVSLVTRGHKMTMFVVGKRPPYSGITRRAWHVDHTKEENKARYAFRASKRRTSVKHNKKSVRQLADQVIRETGLAPEEAIKAVSIALAHMQGNNLKL
jgi:nucleoid DNA-binding protein